MMNIAGRRFFDKDDPKAIKYLKDGRDALAKNDVPTAMRNFKKCYKSNITKDLCAILLNQMANCMDHLEHYDQQQTFLEELCELELNFKNIQKLMNIYRATSNEVKLGTLAEKIKKLMPDNENDEKLAIDLLNQTKDYQEVIKRAPLWLEEHKDEEEVSKALINAYSNTNRIEEVKELLDGLIKRGHEDKFQLELSGLRKECFDFEASMEHLLKHCEIHKENEYGVNKISHTIMSNACYHGTLADDDYIRWSKRALEGTKPQRINEHQDIDTNFFRKIRVGLISYDFRKHSVGKFIMSLFDVISNNTGIETICYYTYPDHKDDFTEVIESRADVFKYVGRYSDKQLRKELLEDKLDILVDLNGQTMGSRLGLIAERFAPIQVTWMGFPFSSFYYNIDYIIGDYFFDPLDGETERYCSEKILRMDPCYMCFAAVNDLYVSPEPPQTYNGHITFGMMNNPNKYSEESIRLWQKCLEAVPDSRLLIQLGKNTSIFVEDKFFERLKKFGLDISRVDFGRDYGQAGYYGTYNKVDVMLDSVPFGGGTTTPEALWMGVPVIGVQYHMRHGRMAYDFMTQVGLGDLCADSVDTYAAKVKEVSENVELLRELRHNLRNRLKDTPLFDTAVFRRAFENAMRDAFIKHCMDNKKPFDTDYYEEKDDGVLLRDCVRAADILNYELTREQGADGERLEALFKEYARLHRYLLERMSDIYGDDAAALSVVLKISEVVNLLGNLPDAASIGTAVKTIRTLLLKFA